MDRQQSLERLSYAIETTPISLKEKASLLSRMMGEFVSGRMTATEMKKMLRTVKV